MGYGLAVVRAEDLGIIGNLPAGTIARAEEGELTANQPEALTGGVDEESDDALKARWLEIKREPSASGNKYDYERWAREVQGIGSALCIPHWDGPGTVQVIIAADGRQEADEALVARCAAHIEEKRPIAGPLTVTSAKRIEIAVEARVTLIGGYALEGVWNQFSAALRAYCNEFDLRGGWLIYTTIARRLSECLGVYDFDELTVNGQTGNILLQGGEISALGELVIT